MNKEVMITAGVVAGLVVVALIVRDNLPNGSFAFKKKA